MRPTAPCYKCEERHAGCHSECELYLAFRKKRDEYNEKVSKERELARSLNFFARKHNH